MRTDRNRGRAGFGPGMLVAAAFIGPGTVTTASLAGARYGYVLDWAILFSVLVTLLLQEMAARLGLVTRRGLGEVIAASFTFWPARVAAGGLVVIAIGGGNAAYEGGNIVGASLGLSAITGGSLRLWSVLIALAGAALLFSGAYRLIEKVLIGLVATMGLVFLTTALIIGPNWSAVGKSLVEIRVPADGWTIVLALIGTTVVPYNLFLHAGAVREKWSADQPIARALGEARRDTILSVSLGGLITLAISISAVPLYLAGINIHGPGELASQLDPLFGEYARWLFGAGLLAAGLTSAVTAPLAAGYAVSGVLGWRGGLSSMRFRVVAAVVLIVGTIYAVSGTTPVRAILVAQAANGLLLPLTALFLLYAANRRELMGHYRNWLASNLAAGAALLVIIGLGWRSFSVILS